MSDKDLFKFYKNIKSKKINYFFGSKDIFQEISRNYKNYFKKNYNVLDLGCGNLEHYNTLKKLNFKSYTGVDWLNFDNYPKDDRFIFQKSEIDKFLLKNKKKYDIILSIGTLEHFRNPLKIISNLKKNLTKKGRVIFAYPNYYNPRGLALITLMHLCDFKVTLSDRYFFEPAEIKKYLEKLNFSKINEKSIRLEGGYKNLALKDLEQRLPKIIKNIKKDKIRKFLKYFSVYGNVYVPNKYSGHIIIVDGQKK